MNTWRIILPAAAILCLVVLAGTASAGPASQPVSQPDGRTLRLVTLNMMGAELATPARIAEAIGRHNPDVVFLQEVTDAQANAIAAALKLNRAATGGLGQAGRQLDTAILSRQPMGDVRLLATTRPGETYGPFGLVATARLADRAVTLVCVHLRSTHPGPLASMLAQTERRWAQVAVLLAAVDKMDGPILLAGDFNEGYKSRSLQRLAKRFGHAFDQAGRGSPVTFAGFANGIQIDHIFFTAPFEATACVVDAAEVSDHRMVVATLRVK